MFKFKQFLTFLNAARYAYYQKRLGNPACDGRRLGNHLNPSACKMRGETTEAKTPFGFRRRVVRPTTISRNSPSWELLNPLAAPASKHQPNTTAANCRQRKICFFKLLWTSPLSVLDIFRDFTFVIHDFFLLMRDFYFLRGCNTSSRMHPLYLLIRICLWPFFLSGVSNRHVRRVSTIPGPCEGINQ